MKTCIQRHFGDAHIQYHDFDNQNLLTLKDKYTALLQQELQTHTGIYMTQ